VEPDPLDSRGRFEQYGQDALDSLPSDLRARGLDKTARRMVGFLEQRGIEGATVLEVGGGASARSRSNC
jgi:hypothetical protein